MCAIQCWDDPVGSTELFTEGTNPVEGYTGNCTCWAKELSSFLCVDENLWLI